MAIPVDAVSVGWPRQFRPRRPAMTPDTGPAAIPTPTHARARLSIATPIGRPVSRAAAASGLRGRARKLIPVAFTKQATARAAVSPRPPTARRAAERDTADSAPSAPAPIRPWNVSHSLAKPLSGGRPLIAAAHDAERKGGDGHRPAEPTEGVEVARPGGRLDRAGRQEQSRLEQGVVEDMEQGRGERHACEGVTPRRLRGARPRRRSG